MIPQMFDVRPIDKDGFLDVKKINSVKNSEIREAKKKPSSINRIMPFTTDIKPANFSFPRFSPTKIKRANGAAGKPSVKIKNPIPFLSDYSLPQKDAIKKESPHLPAKELFIKGKPAEILDGKIEKNSKEEIFERFFNQEGVKYPGYSLDQLKRPEKKEKKSRNIFRKQHLPISSESDNGGNIKKLIVRFAGKKSENFVGETEYASQHNLEKTNYFDKFKSPSEKEWKKTDSYERKKERKSGFSLGDIFYFERYFNPEPKMKLALSFAAKIAIFSLVFLGITLVSKGLMLKKTAYRNSEKAFASLASAKKGLTERNFEAAALNFDQAYEDLDRIAGDINSLGGIIVESSKYVPFLSKLSSGSHMVEAGKDLSEVGALISQNVGVLEKIKNPVNSDQSNVSYLKIFQDSKDNLNKIAELLKSAEENLNSVNVDDIPENQRGRFIELKDKLPQANKYLSEFVANEKIFADILGGNGPRKYLFLFQNNQEMRATGGFIGTYAIIDIFNGRVRNFFVDGIFNPDGQLQERIVPPAPIQKISANWSMHDSNWFPDFPLSAEKATAFYEKTGGPTVDGVIALTPTVLEKLLAITGPIEMPEYGVTIDKDNFIENIQTEVEENYDKELNQPKKILSDIAPKILDKIFNPDNVSDVAKTMGILSDSLNERHILIYAKNWEIEKVLSAQGWSGEVLDTQKDYLSVINTNINGFKTDGVIDEKIEHVAEIQPDGSIIDNLTITRHHNGGSTPYEWWNKVNANYMRVYVPKGSKLISVNGQTREFDSPPLDYDALGYKRDPQVKMEEDSILVDEESGTRIYEDSKKTVFANWVYVSPQETVEVKYTYLLPFKIDTNLTTKPADAYSLLAQKQSGSAGSSFVSKIIYPDFYKILWRYPDNLNQENNSIKLETSLLTDKFAGVAFSRK